MFYLPYTTSVNLWTPKLSYLESRKLVRVLCGSDDLDNHVMMLDFERYAILFLCNECL